MRTVSAFHPAPMPLVELRPAIWSGRILANSTGILGPIEEHLDALDEFVAPYQPGELGLGGRHAYTLAANWKVTVKN